MIASHGSIVEPMHAMCWSNAKKTRLIPLSVAFLISDSPHLPILFTRPLIDCCFLLSVPHPETASHYHSQHLIVPSRREQVVMGERRCFGLPQAGCQTSPTSLDDIYFIWEMQSAQNQPTHGSKRYTSLSDNPFGPLSDVHRLPGLMGWCTGLGRTNKMTRISSIPHA